VTVRGHYVVLRDRARAFKHQLFGEELLALSRAAEPELLITELSKKDVLDAQRDPQTVAFAPPMRVKRIEPRRVVPVDGLADACTWGVEVTGAAQSPYTGRGVVVGIVDSGIDAEHPAFAGVQLVRRDFTGHGDEDVDGHGTHCAGTIFGRSSAGVGRFGVATGVDRALIGKVLHRGLGTSSTLYSAMLWAHEAGAQILSMSLGLDYPGEVAAHIADGQDPAEATAGALETYRGNIRLFEKLGELFTNAAAVGRGTLIVAAAGNESERDAPIPRERFVSPPAEAPQFVSVGALASPGAPHDRLTVAPFSNTGPQVCAPGVAVFSAYLGRYALMDGTSMATPHVAGIAALWTEKLRQAAWGSLDVALLRSRLIGQAGHERLAPGFDGLDVGAGLVRAPRD
jgi:hypothetical protein